MPRSTGRYQAVLLLGQQDARALVERHFAPPLEQVELLRSPAQVLALAQGLVERLLVGDEWPQDLASLKASPEQQGPEPRRALPLESPPPVLQQWRLRRQTLDEGE